MPRCELAEAVNAGRRACFDGLVVKVTLHVSRQCGGGLVATVAVLLHGPHHDPIELATDNLPQALRIGAAVRRNRYQLRTERADPRGRARRLLLANNAANLVLPCVAQPAPIERRRPGEQLV